MAISFVNPWRCYDETVNCLRFSGYDGAFEVSFFLEANALAKFFPALTNGEAELLEAFDGSLEEVHKAASRAYQRNTKSYVCTLTRDDF